MAKIPLVYRLGKPNFKLKIITVCLRDETDWEGIIDVLERQPYWNSYRWRSVDTHTILNTEGGIEFTSEEAVKLAGREMIKKAKKEFRLIQNFKDSK